MKYSARPLVLLALGALVLLTASTAFAVGTPSGTTVSNSATVDYAVGGVAQAPITTVPVTFLVDNRIDLTVATVDAGPVTVLPGSTLRVLTYQVQNDGNEVQDFRLQALDAAAAAFGLTETIDALNVNVFVDGNGNGTYEPAADTATYIDELAADANVVVFVVADIPGTAVIDDVASYDLLAIAATGATPAALGVDAAEDSGVADDPNTVQIVFGDGAGIIDAVTDGQFSSRDSYRVANANVTLAKSSLVVEDPFNGVANPKAIPGARVTYTIDLGNTGTGDADNVAIVDAIPANTVFRVGSVVSNGTVAYSDDGGLTWAYVPVADANGNDATVTHVRATFALLAGGGTTEQTTFDVVIQ
ncbi:MAG: DUF11 domain-containing protein [bacterium]|nr:DUF11 domain-containing protein [bacterium]